MIHKIKFTIEIETNGLTNEEFMKKQSPLYEKIVEDKMLPMEFNELDEIIKLSKRKYYITSIEFPHMEINSSERKETNITIKA